MEQLRKKWWRQVGMAVLCFLWGVLSLIGIIPGAMWPLAAPLMFVAMWVKLDYERERARYLQSLADRKED